MEESKAIDLELLLLAIPGGADAGRAVRRRLKAPRARLTSAAREARSALRHIPTHAQTPIRRFSRDRLAYRSGLDSFSVAAMDENKPLQGLDNLRPLAKPDGKY